MGMCGKLFKSAEFLTKHIRSKHMALAEMLMTERCENFSRTRFEADSLGQRPLPLVEVESANGIEKRSVKDVIDTANARLHTMDSIAGGRSVPGDRRWSDGEPPFRRGIDRGDHRRERFGRDRRGERYRERDRRPVPPGSLAPSLGHGSSHPPPPPGTSAGANVPAKTISYYVDVDEPQVLVMSDLMYAM